MKKLFLLIMLPAFILMVGCSKNGETGGPNTRGNGDGEYEIEIVLNATSLNLKVGEEFLLEATNLEYGTPFWKSSDPGVATVDESGLVTAVAPGRVEIIASLIVCSDKGGVAVMREIVGGKCKITVEE